MTVCFCGGMAMCPPCHYYVLTDVQLPEMGAEEYALPSEAFNIKTKSRLGCKIFLNNDLEDLEIELAPEA